MTFQAKHLKYVKVNLKSIKVLEDHEKILLNYDNIQVHDSVGDLFILREWKESIEAAQNSLMEIKSMDAWREDCLRRDMDYLVEFAATLSFPLSRMKIVTQRSCIKKLMELFFQSQEEIINSGSLPRNLAVSMVMNFKRSNDNQLVLSISRPSCMDFLNPLEYEDPNGRELSPHGVGALVPLYLEPNPSMSFDDSEIYRLVRISGRTFEYVYWGEMDGFSAADCPIEIKTAKNHRAEHETYYYLEFIQSRLIGIDDLWEFRHENGKLTRKSQRKLSESDDYAGYESLFYIAMSRIEQLIQLLVEITDGEVNVERHGCVTYDASSKCFVLQNE